MRRLPLYIVLLSGLAYACHNPDHSRPLQQDRDSNLSGHGQSPLPHNGNIADPIPAPADQKDSVIALTVKRNTDTLSTEIRKDYQQVHIQIPVTNTRHLTAQLKPEGRERNIRISQIEMPDGKTDGPFGAAMEYKTNRKGTYTLIVARNNMAEGEVRGPVQIVVVLD
ncbi:hypothetical protein [Niabella aurantiaca]|uniref:hypothetical protein n=1 Tax=Niabella aurantiaca TaxID=379900 RepID=UPI000362CD04|nr:hypothetical protein [Niabella aurantiaca]